MSDDKNDKQLGMGREITRRDFLNGVAIATGLSVLGEAIGAESLLAAAMLDEVAPEKDPNYYPPGKMGIRGNHEGTFTFAHRLRDGVNPDAMGPAADTRESYDLVVVGGGISGLSAAHFFRKRAGRDARVLVLDNHDDFGGHAKRNEFHIGGRMLLMNGGTAGIDSPTPYSATADGLLRTLGVDATALAARFARGGGVPPQA